ncbi:hypothetical protein AMST5_03335 [freshwater sediment metagenome]|uniref:Uncharacterized protein n=1 Tax=freshwater sediment metagenome TaxID=556182 RepID=A0AA48REJ6_9ZZZZ
MGWRRKLQRESPERDPTPICVATVGLLISLASFVIPDERVSGTLFGSGLITAGICIVYRLANPNPRS